MKTFKVTSRRLVSRCLTCGDTEMCDCPVDGEELARLWNERYGQYIHATDGATEQSLN